MALIKVNGFTINPEKIACIERKTGERYMGGQREVYSGIGITFDAGGYKWIEGIDADKVQAAFEDWDRDRPLPY
jgi:hypothetical protein